MVTHRERLAEVLSDGRWHRARDIAPTDRGRRALRELVRDESCYWVSWVPVTLRDGRATWLRVVRKV